MTPMNVAVKSQAIEALFDKNYMRRKNQKNLFPDTFKR
jgi:hypothetical protein